MINTIVLIHGNFVTRRTWEPWVARYSARGYKVVSIAYPGRDKPVKTLKANRKDPFLRTLDIRATIDHHVALRSGCDTPTAAAVERSIDAPVSNVLRGRQRRLERGGRAAR